MKVRSGLRRAPLALALLVASAWLLAACSADTARVDFAALARSGSPNDALACPAALCPAKVDLVTAPVAMPAAALAAQVEAVLPAEPRTELVSRTAAADGTVEYVLVQRSAVFRFPDTVNVLVRPVDDSHAVIAMYSRSNYGFGDFGVNLARLKTWLADLGVTAAAGG